MPGCTSRAMPRGHPKACVARGAARAGSPPRNSTRCGSPTLGAPFAMGGSRGHPSSRNVSSAPTLKGAHMFGWRERTLLLGLSGLLALSATAQDPTRPDRPTTRPGDTTPAPMQRPSTTGNQADSALATWLLVDNENEIALAQLAQERAKNDEVKQLAKRMADEHRSMVTKLQKFASGTGLGTGTGAGTGTDRDRASTGTTRRETGSDTTRPDRTGQDPTRPGQDPDRTGQDTTRPGEETT